MAGRQTPKSASGDGLAAGAGFAAGVSAAAPEIGPADAAGLVIRLLLPQEVAAAAEILASAPDAWSADALKAGLQNQQAGGAVRLFAARREEHLLGLAAFQLAGGEASLDTLAVSPAARRQGVGRGLLRSALGTLCAEGAECCFLEVRESNVPAIALYAGLGFAIVGRRPGFYRAPAEDALVMRCPLPCAAAR